MYPIVRLISSLRSNHQGEMEDVSSLNPIWLPFQLIFQLRDEESILKHFIKIVGISVTLKTQCTDSSAQSVGG